ncbi:hypothetical protein [Halobellus ruber]|uniref:Uncharacterized protein n=1 Tax=Halobellus ruber TaxID=2761102 RepID=A0A7J9SI84_9EURY|nr:hypothetical protein [Halobellus ruber]MBB6646675.1 hypothetical protein [Halobellus ruber]
MNATRKAIAAFVAATAVGLLTRLYPFVSIPADGVVVTGGLLLGAGLWLLGCYYGYVSTRN